MEKRKILVINMGSTSSQVAYCENTDIIAQREWAHKSEELKSLETVDDIVAFRKKLVLQFLEENNLKVSEMNAIAARGVGTFGSYRHGAYLLTPEVGADARAGGGHQGLMSSTVIADELSQQYKIPAYLYDVVPVDEIYDIARVSGIPNHRRKAGSHTLNGRAVAMKTAAKLGIKYEEGTFIVCHMGGGVGTMCHHKGRIVETYSAEEGSFTPERAGRVPADVMRKVYSDRSLTPKDIRQILNVNVGLYGHLGTNDCREVEKMIANGDKKALLVYQAMAYQLSANIGAISTAVNGKVDAIILTGGVAHSKMMTGWITERVSFIAPVHIVPGAMEVEALAGGITRVLNGEEAVNDYEEVKRPHTLFENC